MKAPHTALFCDSVLSCSMGFPGAPFSTLTYAAPCELRSQMAGATAVSLICGAGKGAQQQSGAAPGGAASASAAAAGTGSVAFEPLPPPPPAGGSGTAAGGGAAPALPPRRRRLVKDEQLVTPREVYRA